MKKQISLEQQLRRLKKRFYILLSFFFAFIITAGTYIYLNYDYLAFKHFISSFYIYTDSLDKVFEKELKTGVNGNYYKSFDAMVISVVTRRLREENNDRYTYLYTPERLKKYLSDEKTEAMNTDIKYLSDKTVYLSLTNFSKYTWKFMQDNYKKLGSRKNIILDLRQNLGGDIDNMADISGMFLEKGSIIATDKTRLWDVVYKAKGDYRLRYEKIIILQGKNTASASENLIAALKDNLPNVTLIGGRTFGKGIGQYTLPLKGGYAVKATILKWFTPKGINIQGDGIEPDISYNDADIIDYANELIHGTG